MNTALILALVLTARAAAASGEPATQSGAGASPTASAQSHRERGQRFHETGRWDAAIAELEQSIGLAPNDSATQYLLGRSYSSKAYGTPGASDLLDKAIAHLRRATELRPDYVDALNELGTIYSMLERPVDAIESFRGALAIRPDAETLHFNLAEAFLESGQPERALTEYQWVLAHPGVFAQSLHRIHNGLGRVFEEQSMLAEAEAELKRAIEIRPDFFQAHVNLGNVYFGRHRLHDAVFEYEKAVRLRPDDLTLYFMVSELYAIQRNTAATIAWLERAHDRGFSVRAAKGNPLFRRVATDPRFIELTSK
jgi:tetratricopeptide (TPR) repeat protein